MGCTLLLMGCTLLLVGCTLVLMGCTLAYQCTVGAHIFGRISVLKNNLAKYRETCSICPNLHHMIDMIPSFKMLEIIILQIHNPELDLARKCT